MSLLALNDELGLSLNRVGLASFDLGDVVDGVLGRIGDFYGLGDDLSKLAGEDDGFSFLEVRGEDGVKILHDQKHFFFARTQQILHPQKVGNPDLSQCLNYRSTPSLLLFQPFHALAVPLKHLYVRVL